MPVIGPSEELKEFIRKLGLDPKLTKRIVIDIPASGVARVYVEGYLSSAAIAIDLPPEILQAQVMVLP